MPKYDGYYDDEVFWDNPYVRMDGHRMPRFATTNLDTQLPDLYPHYTDSRFSSGKDVTIFGAKQAGLHYNYSDRIEQWDYEKAKAARKTADEKAEKGTGRWFQEYLAAFHGEVVELRHIIVGVNVATGYPWHCYGYLLKGKKKK